MEKLTELGEIAAPPAAEQPSLASTLEKDPAPELENRIWELEGVLFGNDPGLKVVEMRRFLPPELHKAAVITGEPAQAETIRGEEQWMGWLEARITARSYEGPLSLDFIVDLHYLFTERDPGQVSPFRSEPLRSGGLTNTDGRARPLVCSDEQLAAVDDNPLVSFEARFPPGYFEPDHPKRKYEDTYPDLGYISHDIPPDGIEAELQRICGDYNEAVSQGDNPYRVAAKLQRQIVSLQPFMDGSNMVARMLQGWSLERAGLPAAIAADFGAEVLSHETAWTEMVRRDSLEAGRMLQLVDDGKADPAVLSGVELEKWLQERRNSGLYYTYPLSLERHAAGTGLFGFEKFDGTLRRQLGLSAVHNMPSRWIDEQLEAIPSMPLPQGKDGPNWIDRILPPPHSARTYESGLTSVVVKEYDDVSGLYVFHMDGMHERGLLVLGEPHHSHEINPATMRASALLAQWFMMRNQEPVGLLEGGSYPEVRRKGWSLKHRLSDSMGPG